MKGSVSNARLGKLSSEKRALLALRQLKARENVADNQRGTIRRQQRQDGTMTFPLSFAQERLWFMSQLEPENVAYNLPGAIRFKGDLRMEVVQQTIDEIVRRHEA